MRAHVQQGVKYLSVPSKIAISRNVGVKESAKYLQCIRNGKKSSFHCLSALEIGHKCYKSCVFIEHAYSQPYLLHLYGPGNDTKVVHNDCVGK